MPVQRGEEVTDVAHRSDLLTRKPNLEPILERENEIQVIETVPRGYVSGSHFWKQDEIGVAEHRAEYFLDVVA